MITHAILVTHSTGSNQTRATAQFWNGTTFVTQASIPLSNSSLSNKENLRAEAISQIIAYAFAEDGSVITENDVVIPWITSTTSPSIGAASRSLNSAFQVSSTRNSVVSYSVDIATSVSLAGGQVGTVYLEYADDSGFTTGVTEVCRFVNGNTGTLVVGLTLNQTNTAPLGGYVPAGKYVRLRTQNNTGTPTFTYRSGQEVLV